MTIIFFGSDPWFSPPVLEALLAAGHEVPLVVTKGKALDKLKIESGKWKNRTTFIQAHRPGDISLSSFNFHLSSHPDAIVLASFGPPFLPNEVLHWPKYGCLNVHASLLPRWRGASPVFAAIAAGDKETGVSIMRMTDEIDHGPVLGQEKIEIRQPQVLRSDLGVRQGRTFPEAFDTRESLTKKLGILGGELIVETLKKLENDQIIEVRQPKKSPTPLTRRLTKGSGRIDWSKTPEEIERFIRAVTPWPGARSAARWHVAGSSWQIAEIKILKAHLEPLSATSYPPRAALIPDLVQLPGKNPISWKAFLAGHPRAALGPLPSSDTTSDQPL